MHLCRGHAGIFGVAAVKRAPHPAHGGRDDIALAKLASWCFLNKTNRLNSKDTRELDARRMALPREQFGAVEPERLRANQDFATLGCGDREALNFENLRPTCFANHCGFHRGHDSSP